MSTLTNITMGLVVLAAGVVGAMNLPPKYGTKLEFKGGELYYTSTVMADEARKLGEFLLETEVFDDDPKTVQIDKRDGVYQFRMVIKSELMDDPELHSNLRVYGKEICNKVFNSEPIEIYMTDESLETRHVLSITPSYGKLLNFEAGELYWTPTVSRDQAEALGTFLVECEFFDDSPKTVQLNKSNGLYEFRFIVKQGFEPDILQMTEFRMFAKQLSDNVFGTDPVDIHMTDSSLFTLKIVTSTNDFDREDAVNSNPFSLLSEEEMIKIGKELLKNEFK